MGDLIMREIDYYKIGQKIRKTRKARGLSQEEIAEAVDISVTHMSHIETGNTKLSLPVAVAIAEVLGISMDDLLNNIENVRLLNESEIAKILDKCSDPQISILTDVIKATKESLDKNS